VGGTRVISSHANGTQVATDMPEGLGGTGDRVTPGWLFRAGMASCLASTIAMHAADQGIELSTLEVRALSRSDTRGLLGMVAPGGAPVHAGPDELHLWVTIGAHGHTPEQLRALVATSQGCAPVSNALQDARPLALHVDIAAS
jgi:uncharacterized OsmC-like protein